MLRRFWKENRTEGIGVYCISHVLCRLLVITSSLLSLSCMLTSITSNAYNMHLTAMFVTLLAPHQNLGVGSSCTVGDRHDSHLPFQHFTTCISSLGSHYFSLGYLQCPAYITAKPCLCAFCISHFLSNNVLRSFEAYYPCISARGTDAMNRLASRMIEAVCKTSLRNLVLFRYTRAHRKCRGRWWCTISLNNCNTSEDDGRSLGSFIVIFRMRGSRKSRFSNFWGCI